MIYELEAMLEDLLDSFHKNLCAKWCFVHVFRHQISKNNVFCIYSDYKYSKWCSVHDFQHQMFEVVYCTRL